MHRHKWQVKKKGSHTEGYTAANLRYAPLHLLTHYKRHTGSLQTGARMAGPLINFSDEG